MIVTIKEINSSKMISFKDIPTGKAFKYCNDYFIKWTDKFVINLTALKFGEISNPPLPIEEWALWGRTLSSKNIHSHEVFDVEMNINLTPTKNEVDT